MTVIRPDLEASFGHCQKVTRERARNFYYGIRLLPEERRKAMCSVYAFFRYCDDVTDDPPLPSPRGGDTDDPGSLLREWREAVDPATAGSHASRILPAFHHTVRTYRIPLRYFYELIEGAEADLRVSRYQAFEELYGYCYRVASTVGLVCLHIFGFDGSQEALLQAELQGIAFQLTNILRDVAEDAGRDRIYLPLEDLHRFGVHPEALLRKAPGPGFADLMRFEVQRARDYYDRSAPLAHRVEPESRPSLEGMTRIYRGLLDRIARMGPAVLKRRATLSRVEKLKLAGQVLLSSRKAER